MPEATILNSLDGIKRIDRSHMLSYCVEAPGHYGEAAKRAASLSVDYSTPETIIVSGMGGSAIGGELLKDWARERVRVPVEVCREYSLPAYVGESSLVVVVSYSGETEESLSVFLEALKRKCMTVCITSGGALQDFSRKLGVPHLSVPSGMAPRATLPYLFIPLPVLLEKLGLVSDVATEVSETIRVLKKVVNMNASERALNENFSKTLASSIRETVPVVYGFGFYRAVAQRFKTQFNENSKVPAKWEYFPELDHNEIVGWERVNHLAKHFSVVFIRDNAEPEAMRMRIEATKDLIAEESVRTFEVHSLGKSTLAKISSVICVGDFTSVYLAVLRGIDPTPVRTISLLKEKIRQSGVKERVIRELQKLADR